jgi:hypothetical protein
MADKEQLAIIKKGVDAWNEWREKNRLIIVDLIGADLRNITLSGANLEKVELFEADLRGANLADANLSKADLVSVTFGRSGYTDGAASHIFKGDDLPRRVQFSQPSEMQIPIEGAGQYRQFGRMAFFCESAI